MIIMDKCELKDWINYEREQYGCSPGVKGYIKYFIGDEASTIWHFQNRMRLTEYYYNTGKKIRYYYSKLLFNHLRNKYSMNIHLNTCGKGLKIMHLGPILMNKNVKVGNGCTFHINTALVAKGTTKEAPTLGDGVVIGVGAVIIGGVHIANNVAVGANAVVNKDIHEENIAVAGVPAKKISDSGRLTWNNKE